MSVSTSPITLSIEPTDDRLSHSKWFYLWNLTPLDECCCPRGSFHRQGPHDEAISGALDCPANPGKHPWLVWNNNEPIGFRHGSAEALDYSELQEKFGAAGAQRRLGLCLNETVMLDIDNLPALQAFYRIARHVPTDDRLLGVAKTPRGWHVYLHAPEWSQKAITLAMQAWLGQGMWHGTDAGKISRRGMVLDVRTGPQRYTVWPNEHSRDRHWATTAEFRAALNFAGRGMPRSRMVASGELAPWNLEMTDELRARIARAGADTLQRPQLALDGSAADQHLAWRELEKWCRMLQKKDPETGRNITLNHVSYFQGTDAIAAGLDPDKVRERLRSAAAACGTPGAEATMTSGLTSGLRDRYARS